MINNKEKMLVKVWLPNPENPIRKIKSQQVLLNMPFWKVYAILYSDNIDNFIYGENNMNGCYPYKTGFIGFYEDYKNGKTQLFKNIISELNKLEINYYEKKTKNFYKINISKSKENLERINKLYNIFYNIKLKQVKGLYLYSDYNSYINKAMLDKVNERCARYEQPLVGELPIYEGE